MKKLLAVTTIFSLLPIVAFAESLDDVEYSIGIRKDEFKFQISADAGELSEVHVGYQWYEKDVGSGYKFTVYSGLEREFNPDRTKIVNDFKVTKTFENWSGFYAIANVDYDFTNENFSYGPTLGAFYTLGEKTSIYGDVTATYVSGEGYVGSEYGAGISHNVYSNIWTTLGFTRNFDTDWDQETSWYINTNFVYWG